MSRRRLAPLPLLLTVAAGALMIAPAAQAGDPQIVKVKNSTTTALKVWGDSSDCWYLNDLDPGASPLIQPGASKDLASEDKNSGGCYGGFPVYASKSQPLKISFVQDTPPAQALASANSFPNNDPFKIYFNGINTAEWRGVPQGWLPVTPGKPGTSGGGAFCVRTSPITAVSRDEDGNPVGFNYPFEVAQTGCLTAPRTSSQAKHGLPARAAQGQAAADPPSPAAKQTVYDVFDMAASACALLAPAQPWGATPCSTAADPLQWDLRNVTTDVKSVSTPATPVVAQSWKQLVSTQQNNATSLPGTINYTLTRALGTSTSTSSTFGYKFGEKLGWKAKYEIPVIGSSEISGEFSSEQNWSDTTGTTTSNQTTESTASSAATKPGGTTYLYAYQSRGDLAFNITADLTAGLPNTAQPLATPVPRALGMSSARNHPCIGYVAGSADPGSLMGLGRAAAAKGLSPASIGISDGATAFLKNVPNFTVSAADHCPGFPDGYPAALAFKGAAQVTAASSGGPDSPTWGGQLGAIKTCVFFKPDAPASAPAPTPDPDHCRDGVQTPTTAGNVVHGDSLPDGKAVAGSGGGELILARTDQPADNSAENQLIAGGGDDILQGAGNAENLIGGTGDDILDGKAGADILSGSDGDDTVDGGVGDDRLSDYSGNNALLGGPGNDRLSSSSKASGGLLGGDGNDQLVMSNRGNVALRGELGNDTYRLLGNAATGSVVEFVGQGVDTIEADRSFTLPVGVERGLTNSNANIALRAGIGDQWLTGGGGRNRLDGGPGADRINGRGGNDTIVLVSYGFDRARGGSGADRFIVRNERPSSATFGLGLEPGAAAKAHVIEDLSVRQGDKLVLSTKRYGSQLGQMRRHPRVTYGAKARGRAPQYIFTRSSSLLRFDADGSGPKDSAVIAILRGYKRVPLRAIQISSAR